MLPSLTGAYWQEGGVLTACAISEFSKNEIKTSSTSVKSSTHFLNDTTRFDFLSKGPLPWWKG
jgi:hypothetical protein